MSFQSKRIVFLDLLRLLAIIMMVQGHSTDVFLQYDYKLPHSISFGTYLFFRGITAPLFLFCSGFIYGVRFEKAKIENKLSKLLKYTIRRGIFLIILGYLAKSPTTSPFYTEHINEDLLKVFLSVDILHLIGFSLILLSISEWISSYLKIKSEFIPGILIILIFMFFPMAFLFDWESRFHFAIASWFTTETGSLFPIMPFAIYILLGALIGFNFYRKNIYADELEMSKNFMILSAMLISSGLIFNQLEYLIFSSTNLWTYSPNFVFIRSGGVLLLASTASLISVNFNKIPRILLNFSKNSLFVYLIHIAILYGTAWNEGIKNIINNSFNLIETVLAVIIFIGLMVLLSEIWTLIKNLLLRIKEKLTLRLSIRN